MAPSSTTSSKKLPPKPSSSKPSATKNKRTFVKPHTKNNVTSVSSSTSTSTITKKKVKVVRQSKTKTNSSSSSRNRKKPPPGTLSTSSSSSIKPIILSTNLPVTSTPPTFPTSASALRPGSLLQQICNGRDIQLARSAVVTPNIEKEKGKYLLIFPGMFSFNKINSKTSTTTMKKAATKNDVDIEVRGEGDLKPKSINRKTKEKNDTDNDDADSNDEHSLLKDNDNHNNEDGEEEVDDNGKSFLENKTKSSTTTTTTKNVSTISVQSHSLGRVEGLRTDIPTFKIPFPTMKKDLIFPGRKVPTTSKYLVMSCSSKKNGTVQCKSIFSSAIVFGTPKWVFWEGGVSTTIATVSATAATITNSKNDTNEMDGTEFSNNKAFLHYGGSERTVNGTKRASKKGLSTTVTEVVTGDTPTGKHNIPILTKHSFNNPSTKFGILAIKSSTTKMAKPAKSHQKNDSDSLDSSSVNDSDSDASFEIITSNKRRKKNATTSDGAAAAAVSVTKTRLPPKRQASTKKKRYVEEEIEISSNSSSSTDHSSDNEYSTEMCKKNNANDSNNKKRKSLRQKEAPTIPLSSSQVRNRGSNKGTKNGKTKEKKELTDDDDDNYSNDDDDDDDDDDDASSVTPTIENTTGSSGINSALKRTARIKKTNDKEIEEFDLEDSDKEDGQSEETNNSDDTGDNNDSDSDDDYIEKGGKSIVVQAKKKQKTVVPSQSVTPSKRKGDCSKSIKSTDTTKSTRSNLPARATTKKVTAKSPSSSLASSIQGARSPFRRRRKSPAEKVLPSSGRKILDLTQDDECSFS